jgi:hypothetical protein
MIMNEGEKIKQDIEIVAIARNLLGQKNPRNGKCYSMRDIEGGKVDKRMPWSKSTLHRNLAKYPLPLEQGTPSLD